MRALTQEMIQHRSPDAGRLSVSQTHGWGQIGSVSEDEFRNCHSLSPVSSFDSGRALKMSRFPVTCGVSVDVFFKLCHSSFWVVGYGSTFLRASVMILFSDGKRVRTNDDVGGLKQLGTWRFLISVRRSRPSMENKNRHKCSEPERAGISARSVGYVQEQRLPHPLSVVELCCPHVQSTLLHHEWWTLSLHMWLGCCVSVSWPAASDAHYWMSASNSMYACSAAVTFQCVWMEKRGATCVSVGGEERKGWMWWWW